MMRSRTVASVRPHSSCASSTTLITLPRASARRPTPAIHRVRPQVWTNRSGRRRSGRCRSKSSHAEERPHTRRRGRRSGKGITDASPAFQRGASISSAPCGYKKGNSRFHRDDLQESMHGVDSPDVFDALLRRRLHCHDPDSHEAHVSTPLPSPEARARIPCTYAHPRRSRRAVPAAPERARAAHRLAAAPHSGCRGRSD